MTAPRAAWRMPRPTRDDLVAGVSVGLVLIPQSLAYADLAGMPPGTGLMVAAAAGAAAAPSPRRRTCRWPNGWPSGS